MRPDLALVPKPTGLLRSLIKVLSDRSGTVPTGEFWNRPLLGNHTLALMRHSRLNFGDIDWQVGLADGVRWALTAAIINSAGSQGTIGAPINTSLQDNVLSDGTLAIGVVQEAYVSN